jgi:hypothetical protein
LTIGGADSSFANFLIQLSMSLMMGGHYSRRRLRQTASQLLAKTQLNLNGHLFVTHCGLTGRVHPQNVLRNGAPIPSKSCGVKVPTWDKCRIARSDHPHSHHTQLDFAPTDYQNDAEASLL